MKDPGTRSVVIKHVLAIALLAVFGIAPLAVFFAHIPNPWEPAPVPCEDKVYNEPSTAIEGLFTIDTLVIRSSFAMAKLIDTAWDLVIGRGGQLLAGLVGYEVFCKALLGALESSPTPFRSFIALSVDDVSIAAVWKLSADIFRHRTPRTTTVFVFMTLASLYILALPTLLSAIAGYISTLSPYIRASDGSVMPTRNYRACTPFADGSRIGLKDNQCLTVDEYSEEDREILKNPHYDAESRFSSCKTLPYK